MTTENQPVEIYRKGTWPIFKYGVRNLPGHDYLCIMIDDDYGDVTISGDITVDMSHWWGKRAHGKESLRHFLASGSDGYFEDKFSYKLSRHNPTEMLKRLREDLKKRNLSEQDMWQADEFLFDPIESSKTADEISFILHCLQEEAPEIYSELESIYGSIYELPSSRGYANPTVENTLRKLWPAFVEHLKKELAEEAGQNQPEVIL